MMVYSQTTLRTINTRFSLLIVLFFIKASQAATSSAVTPGFTYNGDSECSYPFSNFQISYIRCSGSSGTYVQGYNDYDQNDETVCNFGDTMSVAGSVTLDSTAAKMFSISMKVCYGGSDWPTYDPQTCKSSRTTLDLTDYAMLEEAEYYDQEVDESEYYMEQGNYEWRAGFTIPKKTFYFANGSQVRVFLTFHPYEAYQDYPYYNNNRANQAYTANIVDSKYHTMCYASFDAVPVEEKAGYKKYYYRSAAAFVLFGVATYVSMKRKVLCCTDHDEAAINDDHYKAAEDDKSILDAHA